MSYNRFDVNKEYIFVAMDVSEDGKPVDVGLYGRGMPYQGRKIEKVNFLKGVVKEHHQVRGSYQEDVFYDGYIFDMEGMVGYNQYPVYDEGGWDNTHNFVVSVDEHMLDKQYGGDVDAMFKDNKPYNYLLLTRELDNINISLELAHKRLKEAEEKDNKEGVEANKQSIEHLEYVYKEIADAFAAKYPELELVNEIPKDSKLKHKRHRIINK